MLIWIFHLYSLNPIFFILSFSRLFHYGIINFLGFKEPIS